MVGALGATEAVFVIAVLAIYFAPGAIAVAKGHVALFFAGLLLIGLIWIIAAFRLAKPNSPWARRYYGEEKMARSSRRYPDIDPTSPSRAALAAGVGFGLFAALVLAGVIAGIAEGQALG
jgi:hypothetical protein